MKKYSMRLKSYCTPVVSANAESLREAIDSIEEDFPGFWAYELILERDDEDRPLEITIMGSCLCCNKPLFDEDDECIDMGDLPELKGDIGLAQEITLDLIDPKWRKLQKNETPYLCEECFLKELSEKLKASKRCHRCLRPLGDDGSCGVGCHYGREEEYGLPPEKE